MIITLTTDFGYRDPFVGIMKGVILGINPDVDIVDITHGISPQNIIEGSLSLSVSYGYFPAGTIHIAVIDPGVGSRRRPVLAEADGHYFIGPDNGIFISILDNADQDTLKVYQLTSADYFLPKRGATFHGRDIFAPAAAWLSKGKDPSELGQVINDLEKIDLPKAIMHHDGTITGEVISIDVFGNAITNITADHMAEITEKEFRIVFGDMRPEMTSHYSEASDTSLHALINSFEMLELFVFKENAADKFDIRLGDSVTISTF